MDFVELTKNSNRDLYDSCSPAALQRIGREMERAGGLSPLVTKMSPVLTPFPAHYLVELSEIHRLFTDWKEAVKEVRRVLAQSGLKIPDGALQWAYSPHELGALERAARMCQRSGFPDHDSWSEGVKAHLSLWRACIDIGLMEGTVSVTLADANHPDVDEFTNHLTNKTDLKEIRGYQWMGAKRGERAGVLFIEIQVPWDKMEDQAKARLTNLGLVAQQRKATSINEELVNNNLISTLKSLIDKRAENETLRSASSAYMGLIDSPPLEANRVLSVYLSSTKAPAGIALMDQKGLLLEQKKIQTDTDLKDALSTFISTYTPDAAILPSSSSDNLRLRTLLDALKDLSVVRIHPGAINEASEDLEYSKSVAGAVVLGRRALFPRKEWSQVTPSSLGLGEYTRELDSKKLSQTLTEARLISLWDKKTHKDSPNGTKPRSRTVVPRTRLNPLVRTIHDLKPGMLVTGVVTNLTRFGAFLNIGISKEAMIHVSQLSTEFVSDPSQVVKIGQTLSAVVIEADAAKNRIALSLKPDSKPPNTLLSKQIPSIDGLKTPMQTKTAHSPASASPHLHSGHNEKKSRSAALSDLDALFKK
jgi:transcriptional accessory protein Tex/SPT6